MTIFDAHCDTVSALYEEGFSLKNNDKMVDLERLSQYDGYVQVFAAFTDRERHCGSVLHRTNALIDTLYEEVDKNSELVDICTSYGQIRETLVRKKTAALIAVEGGEALEGRLDNLSLLYDRGVRIMTLTWNYDNEICGSAAETNSKGLTRFGRDVVRKMNELGMVIDVSHLSERGFWEVAELSSVPICASHSSAKALCSHSRNLTDEQICDIIERGGCIGVNFYPKFISEGDCDVARVAEHIIHIISLGGENNVGFGSDFDGIDSVPRRLEHVGRMSELIRELLRRGCSEEQVLKIASGNFLRLIKTVLGEG